MEYERYERKMMMEIGEGFVEDQGMTLAEDQAEETAKSKKRRELKDQQKIIQQFDKLASEFDKIQSKDTTSKITKAGGKEVPETAGMLKKKGKKKKEKTLSAKLRMKEKGKK